MDATATALAAAGVKTADGALDGIDRRPLLTTGEGATTARSFFWRQSNRIAFRHGD